MPVAAMANEDKRWYGVQFHPEVTHTRQGEAMLRRFVVDICGCETLWTAANIIDDQIARVREQVGTDEVHPRPVRRRRFVGRRGAAAQGDRRPADLRVRRHRPAALAGRRPGDGDVRRSRHAAGRQGDPRQCRRSLFRGAGRRRDPEAKRKIIGNLFVEIFDEESHKLANAKWLAQGTIYPDVIESAGSKTGKAHVIKSHHNVGGLPEHMKLDLVEPLRELFKDEVRRLGVELGLPREMVYRHPFPGPGLGVRILGEVKREYAELLAKADAIFIEELRKADLYDKTSQAFAVFLPVKSVGVVGDARAYEWVIALRAVETIDFMTAHWAHLPYDFLGTVSNRIINELRGVSRVVYDISGKPPATIEWE